MCDKRNIKQKYGQIEAYVQGSRIKMVQKICKSQNTKYESHEMELLQAGCNLFVA